MFVLCVRISTACVIIACIFLGLVTFSVTRGIGELDFSKPPPSEGGVSVDNASPYLVLDIRERDDYDQCHLITGELHYDHCHLITGELHYDQYHLITGELY
jgi:hypothetical protein